MTYDMYPPPHMTYDMYPPPHMTYDMYPPPHIRYDMYPPPLEEDTRSRNSPLSHTHMNTGGRAQGEHVRDDQGTPLAWHRAHLQRE